MTYSVNEGTTKDEVLAKKERTRRKVYLKKFERKRMKGFMCSELKMREKDIDQDAEIQDALDYLSDIHDSLLELEANHHCYYLVKNRNSKGITKKLNFHFDFQLRPTVLDATYLYHQIIDFIPLRSQNF